VNRPQANRLSDVAFVLLLVAIGVALAYVPILSWLRLVAFDVLLAVAAGVVLYLVLKYFSPVRTMQRMGSEAAPDGLFLGYTLLALLWVGLVISILGDISVGLGGDIAGAALSASAGLLLLFDFHGVTSGIARSDVAVNFILKPAWLSPSRISWHERMALGRATGLAWMTGAVIDVVTTVTR
jgi:zinc transporter ZupT